MPRMLKAAESLQIKGLSNVRSKREAPNEDEEEDCDKSDNVNSNCDNNNGLALTTLPNRRGSGLVSSEIPERPAAVPLHRRRKRARTTSHEVVFIEIIKYLS
jgi:hypothetical protein